MAAVQVKGSGGERGRTFFRLKPTRFTARQNVERCMRQPVWRQKAAKSSFSMLSGESTSSLTRAQSSAAVMIRTSRGRARS